MSFLLHAAEKLTDAIPGIGNWDHKELGKVFVTTGYGPVGYRVTLSLLKAGIDLRVGIPTSGRIVGEQEVGKKTEEILKKKGAECVEFDWTQEDDVAKALEGIQTVVCVIPRMEAWDKAFPDFLQAVKKAKCDHIVKLSFFHAGVKGDPYAAVPFVKIHEACDDLVENAVFDSRLTYTILAASHMMSDPLVYQGKRLKEEHKFMTASYGMGVNYVSPNDVADAIICCLVDLNKHKNKKYTLTGGRPEFDEDVAKYLSAFYGAEIELVELGYHKYKEHMKGEMPIWLARDAAAMERIKASGADEKKETYTKDIKLITGKIPESYESYLKGKSAMSLQELPSTE